MNPSRVLNQIDHLVYGTPDLGLGIREIERKLGVRPVLGGRHLAWGTHNALLSLGEKTYLEILAPDPQQPDFQDRRLFDVDRLGKCRLLGWVARHNNLEKLAQTAVQHGLDLGEIQTGSRALPGGKMLSWRLTDPFKGGYDGLVPFFIDWGNSLHPGKSAPMGCRLEGLRGEHPEAKRIQGDFDVLELEFEIKRAEKPALVATLRCPNGVVELR